MMVSSHPAQAVGKRLCQHKAGVYHATTWLSAIDTGAFEDCAIFKISTPARIEGIGFGLHFSVPPNQGFGWINQPSHDQLAG